MPNRFMSVFLLAALACGQAAASSPKEAVRLAAADVATLSLDRQQQARYLGLYHITDVQLLQQWDRVLRFHVNSLSTEVPLVKPVRIAPGLWRVYLDDYGWKREVWERLLEAGEVGVEPYFHVRILQAVVPVAVEKEETIEVPTGNRVSYDGGRTWANETKKVTRKRKVEQKAEAKTVAAAAPWLDAAQISALILATQSQVPIVRADWWLYQTGAQKDRKAGYYDFLNLGKKRADFQALSVVDRKAAARLKLDMLAVVGRSSVTLHNREIEFQPAFTGAYFASNDFDSNVDKKNPLRLLDGLAKAQAHEDYLRTPGGLWYVALFDGEDNRQDTAPDFIASDGKARGTDRRVHVGISCFRCHEEGLRPVNNWMKAIYEPPFSLDSIDYRTQKRLRVVYLGEMGKLIDDQNRSYAEVLKGLNGLTPAANARAYADSWDAYELADRDMDAVARELGVEPKLWRERLKRAATANRSLDPVLAALYQGLPLRFEHLEEVFPVAMQIASQP